MRWIDESHPAKQPDMTKALPNGRPSGPTGALTRLAPGMALCAALALAAYGVQAVEAKLLGRAWLEAVALAILGGALVRTAWTPGPVWRPGINVSAKLVLEIAVVLLGATIDARAMAAIGIPLLLGIAIEVIAAIAASYGIGRLFGLPQRMSILIACGNAICGNSAIAAVAPVIGADGEDVAASISFTAAIGVALVLGLPLAAGALNVGHAAFGVFAGLTVYAVPQVLAATAPVSALSTQIGTVTKLTRVLMLGPVIALISLIGLKEREDPDEAAPAVTAGDRPVRGASRRGRPALGQLLPWFIVGFMLLIIARSTGLAPRAAVGPATQAANILTIVSMAALGLGVDMGALSRAGARVSAVVTLSITLISVLAVLLIVIVGVR